MTSNKATFWIVVFGLVGSAVYSYYWKTFSPQASVDLKRSRSEIIDRARDYLEALGYSSAGLDADANFRFDSGTALYLDLELGPAEAHQILRADSLVTHDWHIYFFDRSLAPSQMIDQYNVHLTPSGKVLGFEHIIADSASLSSLQEDAAYELARSFLENEGKDLSRFKLENSAVNQLNGRRDYAFRWTGRDSLYRLQSRVEVEIHGDKVGRYRFRWLEPKAYNQKISRTGTVVTYIVTISSIATFVLLIFIISLFLKKYHDGEVGVKTGIYVFCILFGLTFFEAVLKFTTAGYGTSVGDVNRFNVRIIVFIITVFIIQAFLAAMVFAGWSVGESSARRGWSDKLKALDGLRFGKPFTLAMANAIVRGYAFGFMILALLMSCVALAASQIKVGMFLVDLGGVPESFFPALTVVLLALRLALLNEIVFRFFFITWLREKTRNVWAGLIISSLLWTLLAFTLWDSPVGYMQFSWLFPAYFVLSMLLGLIMVRCDLTTAIFTNFVVLALGSAAPLLASTGAYFQTQKLFFGVFMSLPLVVAGIGYLKRQVFKFTLELTPTHIRRISERERMARELEIARNVQMSLLPKENPLAEGYDIAGVCIPALEVGGDYYDFFQLEDGKIGIAIGDVSGKGVPAAIYMTLTKGILQSHAGESMSPRDVLDKLNRQMYLNIERSSFVSMFYAVLDMKGRKIRFSRAGHNPAILAQRSTEVSTLLQPKGMALGLEKGPQFQSFLEEHELSLQSGDVLTFYTDGFSEATNEAGEEFGEDRLEKVIARSKQLSANGVIQHVVRSVKTFVGNHPQHDDMTMVVVKVM